jgi:hypothetical protein
MIVLLLSFTIHAIVRGPYRGRTGDLHNAIVALSQTELTAPRLCQYTQRLKESQSRLSLHDGTVLGNFQKKHE